MKKSIHPESSDTLVIMTDGSSYKVTSTFRKKRVLWKLDMDTRAHIFWNGESNLHVLEDGGQIAKFKKRFFVVR